MGKIVVCTNLTLDGVAMQELGGSTADSGGLLFGRNQTTTRGVVIATYQPDGRTA